MPTNPRHTTHDQEAAALAVYRGEWDTDGTHAVYLPRGLGDALLLDRGWTHQGARGRWVSPAGRTYWETEEALQIALAGEALCPAHLAPEPEPEPEPEPTPDLQPAIEALVAEREMALDDPDADGTYAGYTLAEVDRLLEATDLLVAIRDGRKTVTRPAA